MKTIYHPEIVELIDVDDVIRDFNGCLNKLYNKYHPKNQKSSLTTWDMTKHYGPDIVNFYQIKHAEEIYTTAPIIPGAIEFLLELSKVGVVHLISSQPNKQIEQYTEYWIKANNVPYDELTFTHKKGDYEGNHLLDDATHNLEAAFNSKKSVPVCYNQLWNQDWKGLRVYNHREFLDLVRNHHSA